MPAASSRHRWQAAACAAGLLYLAGDLWIGHGPLRRWIEQTRPDSPKAIARAKAEGVIARVHFQPITRSQLDRAVIERLWLEGRTWAEVSLAEQPAVLQAALDELIDRELLRIETQRHGEEPAVHGDAADQAYQRFASRFASEPELEQALARDGLTTNGMRQRLAAQLAQNAWLERQLATPVNVGEDEARQWFEKHAAALGQPERVHARQIFLATLEREPAAAETKLRQALAELQAGETDFVTLAEELSEDEATKSTGGDLGWMTRDRLPDDFARPLFALPPRSPALIRTQLGWHLVEVLEKKPAETRDFEQARAETIAALATIKRGEAAAALRQELRQREAGHIEVWLEF